MEALRTTNSLLRDGAEVRITTRFPQDAVDRFRNVVDSADWWNRLTIDGLDLRDLPAVEDFAHQVRHQEPYLDILVHNAAQTIKRPLAYYRRLLPTTTDPKSKTAVLNPDQTEPILLEARSGYQGQIPGVEIYFPRNCVDRDGHQVDRRPMNSWRTKIGEISTVEMLEVTLVNCVAPFVLTNHLTPALIRSPHPRRFIVNVSAMEGQFARETKDSHHPHTNMAKAALNMLTRTVAADLAGKGVYVNSVDTGWITDEKPVPQAERVRDVHGFYPPLDAIDGAARIYDPIARGINEPEQPFSGHFLKDYAHYPW